MGRNYTLACGVFGADDLNFTINSYKLSFNNGIQTQVLTNHNMLYFNPLQASDIGQYTCEVNISSYYLLTGGDRTIMGIHDIGLPESESSILYCTLSDC